MDISYGEYLANPKYRIVNPFRGFFGWLWAKNRPPSVEELQEKYAFSYYSTMNAAVNDVNNGTIGQNADIAEENKAAAVAGIYTDENGGKNVVLLKDHTEATRILPSVDMTINLGGNTLSADDTICINVLGGNLIIEADLDGSAVEMHRTSGALCVQIPSYSASSSVCINGGTYFACSDEYKALGVNVQSVSTNITLSNCDIRAYSNYTYDETGVFYAFSQGICNKGTLTLNDCYVMGNHSGVENHGSLTVNGGTYEGYGHGGIYFAASDTTSYVRDAIIRECAMPDGYTATANRNGAGMYISGTDAVNQTVYMDNCDIYGSSATQTIAIASSYDAQNNKLYISNSTINNLNGGIGHVRIDDTNHKMYIGAGNNFTAENTSLPEAVVVTNDVYREVV